MDSITVQVHSGNSLVKDYIGQELTVQLTENTHFLRWTENVCVPITFSDVSVGDSIHIDGTVSEGEFTALRVIVDVPLDCTP